MGASFIGQLALKINTDDNFEDYFYHVNQMLADGTQVQTSDWPTSRATPSHGSFQDSF